MIMSSFNFSDLPSVSCSVKSSVDFTEVSPVESVEGIHNPYRGGIRVNPLHCGVRGGTVTW